MRTSIAWIMGLMGVPLRTAVREMKALVAEMDEDGAHNELLERALAFRGIRRAAIVRTSLGAYRAFMLALSGKIDVTTVVSLGMRRR